MMNKYSEHSKRVHFIINVALNYIIQGCGQDMQDEHLTEQQSFVPISRQQLSNSLSQSRVAMSLSLSLIAVWADLTLR